MEVVINPERFFQRLERLQAHWKENKTRYYNGADVLCIPFGTTDEMLYSKSSSLHLYLLGYEFPDSIIIITPKSFHFMATAKKCAYLESALMTSENAISVNIIKKEKDEGVNRENFHNLMNLVRKTGKNIGSIFKQEYAGSFIPGWMEFVKQSQVDMVEISGAMGMFFAVKDEAEQDLCKRAAVLTNKVMKHGFVQEMEGILDADTKIKHLDLAKKVEGIIYDPSTIGVKIAADVVESCFEPIVQSGGKYDIKVTAQNNEDILSPDIIICSLGSRYKSYCANLSRTFMVDAPSKVEKTYGTLMALYETCLEQMVPGHELKDVYETAKSFLTKRDASLLAHLPKSLGFAIGLEFRDGTLVINEKTTAKFTDGMIFTLSVGFHNVPLAPEDKTKATEAYKKMSAFSLLVADTVRVQAQGIPEVLTKVAKDFVDVSYNLSDKAEDGDDDGDDDDEEDGKKGSKVKEEGGPRRSGRREQEREVQESAAMKRSQMQHDLMKKRVLEAARKAEKGEGPRIDKDGEEVKEATEIRAYKSVNEYPRDVTTTQIKVDMEKESMLVPIGGRAVPFHVSMIKNITMPEQDRATWLRINFYVPGGAMGKEVPKNVQQLVIKHGDQSVFIKELTFRSLDSRNLNQVNMSYQELRKRIKLREQKLEQEKDLVQQTKLIKIKDQRVPRLQDLTMRPQLSGRKCVGSLEAHQNGLRFMSNKGEVLDILYSNIKHCIYQPCDKTTMVLVHFHLKDFIMIGKKKQKDVQWYAEVVDASINMEGSKRYSYDPDELDEEQREREMRKRLNTAFKEFCQKVEKVAQHYDYSLSVDVPFRKSGFEGNPSKEMVLIQPTTHALVNLTEMPFFVVTLANIDHVHFERITYATKNFDLVLIFKDFTLAPRIITAIDVKLKDNIQDWLNLVEITYTEGPRSLNWTALMETVRGDVEAGIFYLDQDEEGEKKPAGWMVLSVEDSEDEEGEEEEDEDSAYSGDEQDSEDGSEDSDDSDDSESDYDEESDEDDYDEDEEDALEEKGQDWDEMEREAAASDRAKRTMDEDPKAAQQANKKQKTGGGGPPVKGRR